MARNSSSLRAIFFGLFFTAACSRVTSSQCGNDNSRFDATICAGSNFLPNQVSGLYLWLRGDSLSDHADSDPISVWSDESGHSNDATQLTTLNQPTFAKNKLNGNKSAVFFNSGSSNFFTYNTPYIDHSSFSVFAVFIANPLAPPPNFLLAGNTATPDRELIFGYDFTSGEFSYGQFAKTLDIALPASSTGDLISGIRDLSTGRKIYHNGTLVATDSYLTPITYNGGGYIGQFQVGDFYSGYIAEILIYNVALSDIDRKKVEFYLGQKYGI